jgi:hypothetical protein
MSVQHANRGIVKKDLQLYYNREFQKSFRGEATSNLIMNPSDANYYQGLYNFTVTPNAETAPDGTNNAWSLAWNGTAFNYYSKNFPISNSTVYTTSVFAKAGTHNVIWIGISNMSGGENNASFNLTTGVATNGSPASTSCSMVYYGNGWWRCITTNTSGTSGTATTAMTVSIGSGRASLGTVYFWGFQAEKKSYATPFLDSLNPIRNQAVTNLYSADPYDGFDLISTYNYQGSTGATISVVSGIINPINSPTVMRYYTGTTGYQYFALTKSGLSSGTYTVSYYARLDSGGPTGLTNTQLWRDGGTDLSVEGDWNPTFYTYWRRFRTTASVTSGTLHFFPIHGGSIAGGSIVYYTGFQLESGSEPKSFTPSSVSTINTIAAGSGLLDISGNNVNANLTNVAFDSAGYYFTTAGSNYINTGITTLPSNTQLTIDVWTKPTSTTQQKTLVSKWGSSAQFNFCFLLFLNWFAQGNIYFLVGSANGDGYSNHSIPHNLSTSAYSNFTIVYDNGNISWYRNGIFIQTETNGNQRLRSVNTPITIGADYDGGNPDTLTRNYDGTIPNVRLYSRPLTASEVLQNFNATRATYGV